MTLPKNNNQVAVTVTISAVLSQHLQALAIIKSTDMQQLASRYLEERIEQDVPMLRRKQYFDHLKEVMKKHKVPPETIETLEENFLY